MSMTVTESHYTSRPLVSIGLLTYNRPDGLKVALERITTQTYTALEIIVSDNHSDNGENIRSIIDACGDDRIKYYRQTSNIGAIPNFAFVVRQSSGAFFMWASDDDYFESADVVANLVAELSSAPDIALAFPDFNFVDSHGRLNSEALYRRYANCKTASDYSLALCRSGVGHPLYGLYKRCILTDERLNLFCRDLAYFNEGIFLHSVFLDFTVKFVPGIYIRYQTSDILATVPKSVIVKDFIKYSARLIRLYGRSKLTWILKCYFIAYLILWHNVSTLRFMLK